MQKPDVNFYETQAKFNQHWANKLPEKGKGYKAFRRWEWYWQWRVDTQGNFPKADIAQEVGMDVGVYYRNSSMPDWVLFSTNLPNVEVFDLDIHYGTRQLQAATYGRGIWRSALAVGLSTAPPTISNFTPTSGPTGTEVTITGTNFLGVTAVSFNNVNASSFTVNSATELTAQVPAGATTGRIRVASGQGTATSATDFIITVPQTPTITNFTPASGSVGTLVTITGTNFTGASAVNFNNNAASSFVVNSATQITAAVALGTTTGIIQVPAGLATCRGVPVSLAGLTCPQGTSPS
jgi:IPT/TIG domain